MKKKRREREEKKSDERLSPPEKMCSAEERTSRFGFSKRCSRAAVTGRQAVSPHLLWLDEREKTSRSRQKKVVVVVVVLICKRLVVLFFHQLGGSPGKTKQKKPKRIE